MKTHMLEPLFNKVAGLKKRLQHRCFPVKLAKLLRTPTLKNICERLPRLEEVKRKQSRWVFSKNLRNLIYREHEQDQRKNNDTINRLGKKLSENSRLEMLGNKKQRKGNTHVATAYISNFSTRYNWNYRGKRKEWTD